MSVGVESAFYWGSGGSGSGDDDGKMVMERELDEKIPQVRCERLVLKSQIGKLDYVYIIEALRAVYVRSPLCVCIHATLNATPSIPASSPDSLCMYKHRISLYIV